MRKTLYGLAVLCITIVAMTACSLAGTPAAEQESNGVEKMDVFSSEDDTTVPDEPPRTLIFNSLQECESFAQSVHFKTDAFVSYVEDNHLQMNGIQTKEDVAEVLDLLASLPIPSSESFRFVQMIIDLDRRTCFVLFNGESDERCSFLVDIDKINELNAQDQTKDISEQAQQIPIDGMEEMDHLYIVDDTSSNSQVSYLAEIDGYSVLIRTYEMQEKPISSTLSTFEFQSNYFSNVN